MAAKASTERSAGAGHGPPRGSCPALAGLATEREGFRACERISVVSAFRRTLSGPAEAGHYQKLDFFTGSSADRSPARAKACRCSAKALAERVVQGGTAIGGPRRRSVDGSGMRT